MARPCLLDWGTDRSYDLGHPFKSPANYSKNNMPIGISDRHNEFKI